MKKSSQTTYTNLPKNNNSKINNEKTTSWTCIRANLHFNWTWFETKKEDWKEGQCIKQKTKKLKETKVDKPTTKQVKKPNEFFFLKCT